MSESQQPRNTFLDDARAIELLERHFGVRGEFERLPSYQDQNYRVRAEDGDLVFKIISPDASIPILELQNRVLQRIGERDPGLSVPRVRRTTEGEPLAFADSENGGRHALRLLTWLPGRVLAGTDPRPPELLRSLGATLARLHGALEGFEDPAARRDDFEWDLTRAHEVIGERLEAITEEGHRALVRDVRERFLEDALPVLDELPAGVLHGDANDHNVLVSEPAPSGQAVTGLLDFGDVVQGPLVCDLAIAAAYGGMGTGDPLAAWCEVVRGYAEARELTGTEADVLYALLRARLGVSVAISAARPEEERAADPYLTVSEGQAWAALEAVEELHPRLGRAHLREAAGHPPCPNSVRVVEWLGRNQDECGALVEPPLEEERTVVFDVSPASPMVERLDRVLDPEAFTRVLFGRMAEAGVPVGIGRYGEPRLWYASDDYRSTGGDFPERRTVHTAIDLFMEPGSTVLCPLDAVVHSFRDNADRLDYGPTIILEHAPEDGPVFWTLYGHLTPDSLEGLEVGKAIPKGTAFAGIGDHPANGDWPPHLHFQIVTDLLGMEGTFPGVCRPSRRAVWTSFSPDPALMIELPPGTTWEDPVTDQAIVQARRRFIGPNLSISYAEDPLRIVRGWMQHLYTPDGQPWLDCVNNVCHVGHANPRVVRAAREQMAVLNTNTRYLHPLLVEYAERLVATLPDPLEVCFFVNSGSEATELALRMARTVTARRKVIVLEAGYHGNTGAAIEVSPHKFDGPGGTGAPDFVQVAPLPDTYRGRWRADDPAYARRLGVLHASGVSEALERAGAEERRGDADDDHAIRGTAVAAFLHESILSCGGQIPLPDGYLAEAYPAVRMAGGLCIADEVQTGFGRVGSHFWAFELQGVVPDMVTLGKPMGNGHPLGAVVTTRKIADAFANGMEYFNTFGGNPVSCAVGMAVLDEIEDQGLQTRALEVGERLKAGLDGLREDCAALGDVRGHGLFLGAEFATPKERIPLPDVARYVVHRMKDRGILLSTDGPDRNVIKIKPPMIFDEGDADRVTGELRHVLAEDFVRELS